MNQFSDRVLPLSVLSLVCLVAITCIWREAGAVSASDQAVDRINFAAFAKKMSTAIENAMPGMPFFGSRMPSNQPVMPLDFAYTSLDAPANPVTTDPMSKTKFMVRWTIYLNDDGEYLRITPANGLIKEFKDKNDLSRCPSANIDTGISAFGEAACNASSSSGQTGASSLMGPLYTGSAWIAVRRPCGLLVATGQLNTHSPATRGREYKQDAVNEIRALASKYTKDVMADLLKAFDPVCSGVVADPIPTRSPGRTSSPTPAPTASRSPSLRMQKLVTYYNAQHHDSVTIVSDEAMRGAEAGGYRRQRDAGGFVFVDPVPGSIALNLWYNSNIGDYCLTTATDHAPLTNSGYQYVRTEGYAYPSQQPRSMPLKLFWSAARGDYLTTASVEAEAEALRSGYVLMRIEGYVAQ